ncbi:MAG: TrkA C-terminal domain-containing protein [Acidimicrobiales bacterium]
MSRPRMVVRARTPVAAALAELRRRRLAGAPVVDEAGRFQGTVRLDTLAASAPPDATAGGRADVAAPAVPATSRLDVALEALATAPGSWVPVLDDDRRVVGTLSVSDLVSAYRRELLANVERIGGLGRTAGTFDLRVDDGSPAAGTALRQANLPKGVLVTSVRRGNDVLVPSGDTVLAAGDILSLLGRREAAQGLEDLGVVAPLAGHDT